MAKNIIVIGKNGQVAWELAQLKTDHTLSFFGRKDIDITSPESIKSTLGQLEIDAIINASAYTAVDKAEEDVEQAYAINAIAVKNLVEFCKTKNIHFTHISTDYVFGGDKGSPYLPEDEYNPQSVYGASKMEGEKHIRSMYPENSSIVRTSWVYSSHGNNFVKTMLHLLAVKESLGVIDDQIGSPTNAEGLAKACLSIANKGLVGVYHWTDLGVCSWYDFAKSIQEIALDIKLLNKTIPINPISTSDYPTAAVRPSYSVLKKLKTDSFECKPLYWKDGVARVIKVIQ